MNNTCRTCHYFCKTFDEMLISVPFEDRVNLSNTIKSNGSEYKFICFKGHWSSKNTTNLNNEITGKVREECSYLTFEDGLSILAAKDIQQVQGLKESVDLARKGIRASCVGIWIGLIFGIIVFAIDRFS